MARATEPTGAAADASGSFPDTGAERPRPSFLGDLRAAAGAFEARRSTSESVAWDHNNSTRKRRFQDDFCYRLDSVGEESITISSSAGGAGEGAVDEAEAEEAVGRDGKGAMLRLRQTEHSIGTCVWTAAILLSKFLEHDGSALPLAGRRVVELGAGTGLCGIVAACLGARVVLTDMPGVLPNLRDNVEAHRHLYTQQGAEDGAGVAPATRVEELVWGETAIDDASPCAGADLVLGSDLVHIRPLVEPLLETMATLAGLGVDAGPELGVEDAVRGAPVLYAYDRRGRTGMRDFVALAPEKFVVRSLPQSRFHPRFRYDEIEVLWMRLRA